MFVAIVYTPTPANEGGQVSAFVRDNKEEAVRIALMYKDRWERRSDSSVIYRVLVGELTEEALPSSNFTLKSLPEKYES